MRVIFCCYIIAALFIAVPSSEASHYKKWHPYAEVDLRASNKRQLGKFDLFLPIAQDFSSMLFADLRGVIDFENSREGNIGLGYRSFFGPYPAILGGYIFYDHRLSPNNNHFKQITIGAEFLTENWDLRSNVYIPEGKEYIVNTSGYFGASINRQLKIAQNQVREKASNGFDFEIGRKVPSFEDLSVFVAYFNFNEGGYQKIHGPRVRLEYNLSDYVKAEAEFQRDQVRKTNFFYGLRVRIPLQKEKSSQRPHLSALDKRMTNRIVRDVDVVAPSRNVLASQNAVATIGSRTSSNIYQIDATNVPEDIQAFFNSIEEDAIVVFDGSLGEIPINKTIFLRKNQSVLGGTTTNPISLTGGGITVSHAPSLVTRPNLFRSAAMIAAKEPMFFIPEDGNILINDVALKNRVFVAADEAPRADARMVVNTDSPISTNAKRIASITFDNIFSEDVIDLYMKNADNNVTMQNSEVYGAVFHVNDIGGFLTANIQNNRAYLNGMKIQGIGPNFAIYGAIFLDSNDDADMNITMDNNVGVFDLPNKGAGSAAALTYEGNLLTFGTVTGIFGIEGAAIAVPSFTNNSNIGPDVVRPGVGTLLQAYNFAGKVSRLTADKVFGNTGYYLETLNADINIGKAGFAGTQAGYEAANVYTSYSHGPAPGGGPATTYANAF